jgi:hypothetical protein
MLKGAFCKVCKTNLGVHKADLMKHTKSNVHKKQMKSLNPVRHGQSTLTTHVVVQVGNREKERDLKLAVYCVLTAGYHSPTINCLKPVAAGQDVAIFLQAEALETSPAG